MSGVLGIDPGKTGGLAVVTQNGAARAWKMPETDRDLLDLVGDAAKLVDFAYVEKVRPHPKHGCIAAWKLGGSHARICMALAAARIPYEEVAAGVWQRGMGCLSKGDKRVTRSRAQELFPDQPVTHAVADALLIAEWGRRRRAKESAA